MKRRAEYLVEKRDGRTEWLRATKLARSIHAALLEAGVDESWRALDLACAVLSGLRARTTVGPYMTTSSIADAVQQVLIATGQARAAAFYVAVSADRERRRGAVRRMLASRHGWFPGAAHGAAFHPGGGPAGESGGPAAGAGGARGE